MFANLKARRNWLGELPENSIALASSKCPSANVPDVGWLCQVVFSLQCLHLILHVNKHPEVYLFYYSVHIFLAVCPNSSHTQCISFQNYEHVFLRLHRHFQIQIHYHLTCLDPKLCHLHRAFQRLRLVRKIDCH